MEAVAQPLEVLNKTNLEELAAWINRRHERIVEKGRSLVEDAIRQGQDLLDAQRLCKEQGINWYHWKFDNLQLHTATAERYMRLADHAEFVRKSEARSIADAMRILKGKPRRGHGPRKYEQDEIDKMREVTARVGFKKAAKELGCGVGTIHKYAGDVETPTRVIEGSRRRVNVLSTRIVDCAAQWLCDNIQGYPSQPNIKVRLQAERLCRALSDA